MDWKMTTEWRGPTLGRRWRHLGARHIARLALAVVALGLLWRAVRYALCFPIWGDEAMLLTSVLIRNFVTMLQPLEHGVTAPIGFMWAELAVARTLGISEWALRLLPFIAGVSAVFVYWRFANRILDRRAALLAVAIFACAYFPVRHTAEAKPYSTDLLIALVLTWLGWAVYRHPEKAFFPWAALTVASTLAVWASYPSIFVSGGIGLLLTCLLWQRPSLRTFIGWAVYGLCTMASFCAMYLLVGQANYEATASLSVGAWEPGFPPVLEPWRLPLWFLDIHTSLMLAYPVGGKYGGSALTFVFVVVAGVVLWRRNRALLLLLLGPLLFTFAAAAMQKYPYGSSARVSLYMAPAFCLLAGVGLNALLRKRKKGSGTFCAKHPKGRSGKRSLTPFSSAGIILSVALISLVPILGMVKDVVRSYKNPWDQETRRIMVWLRSQTGPADQWVVFNAMKADASDAGHRRHPKVPYAPSIYEYMGSGGRIHYYVTRFAPMPVRWGPPAAEVGCPRGGRLWLIVYHDNIIPLPADLLNAYLRDLTERLGQPQCHKFPLGRTIEEIEIYEFPPGS